MGKVIASASMSLDGFVAFEDDDIGELFEWYENGDVEIVNEGELPPFHVTRASADYWRSWVGGLGVLVVGRELFDLTDGWHGRHPIGVPVVVVTHDPPRDWSYPGSEDFAFVTEGIAAAVERAKEIAGDGDIGLAAGTIRRAGARGGPRRRGRRRPRARRDGLGQALLRRCGAGAPRRSHHRHRGPAGAAPALSGRARRAGLIGVA